ncbi:hypothetical protein G3N59_13850 [Paraburkholderia sp. Ac-20340]|uniref:hypothetical protein n=1 Tax=Paraburkholderia sp. Ac-20340 TaxID=2703888 RepID=UPI00198107A9|nr:hypothetical protein [Paraburkholderia sp. Ac-20340]MBN3854466.1 hypothetical protein [Paraburkholderia sp. Ac-20340]
MVAVSPGVSVPFDMDLETCDLESAKQKPFCHRLSWRRHQVLPAAHAPRFTLAASTIGEYEGMISHYLSVNVK